MAASRFFVEFIFLGGNEIACALILKSYIAHHFRTSIHLADWFAGWLAGLLLPLRNYHLLIYGCWERPGQTYLSWPPKRPFASVSQYNSLPLPSTISNPGSYHTSCRILCAAPLHQQIITPPLQIHLQAPQARPIYHPAT